MRITFQGYLFDKLIFNGKAKTKLAMLTFLYCGEIVTNCILNPEKEGKRVIVIRHKCREVTCNCKSSTTVREKIVH